MKRRRTVYTTDTLIHKQKKHIFLKLDTQRHIIIVTNQILYVFVLNIYKSKLYDAGFM